MSPWPSSASAPPVSRITRESVCDDTANAIRDGTLALIMPVMTSTRGLWVAEHEVDADGARLLREPDDRVLDLGRRDHHQVGQLVDHDQDVRHRVAPCVARDTFSSPRLRAFAAPMIS